MKTADKIIEACKSENIKELYVIFGSSITDIANSKDERIILDRLLSHIAADRSAIVNGGYMGTMLSTARAAKAAGGKVIGVPCANLQDEISVKDFDIIIPAEDHWERLRVLVEIGNVFVILPGGIGTVVELAALLWNIDRHFKIPVPILLIGSYWDNWINEIFKTPFSLRDRQTLNNIIPIPTLQSLSCFLNSLPTGVASV